MESLDIKCHFCHHKVTELVSDGDMGVIGLCDEHSKEWHRECKEVKSWFMAWIFCLIAMVALIGVLFFLG